MKHPKRVSLLRKSLQTWAKYELSGLCFEYSDLCPYKDSRQIKLRFAELACIINTHEFTQLKVEAKFPAAIYPWNSTSKTCV